MLKVGQYLKISGFPNLRMEVTKIIEAESLDSEEARIKEIEITLRYLYPNARLLELKLPRVKTIVDILNSQLGYLPESINIKTDDSKLFATLQGKEVEASRRGLDFGDFDQFEEVIDQIYHQH